MKRLILCNTYYQLIFAMQLRKTLFCNDEVSVVISDQSKNAKCVAKNLDNTEHFNNVYYKETKWLKEYNKFRFFIDFIKLKKTDLFSDILKEKYAEFIFFNYDLATEIFFQGLCKTNKEVNINRFEEGILSYNAPIIVSGKMRILELFNRISRNPSLPDETKNFYCFQSDFYKGNLNPIKVPPVDLDSEIKDIILRTFSLNLEKNSYKEKYIFFTSVYDFEGGESIGEYELVCKVADLVGKENLLIKTHPRDTRTIYEDNGFNVDKNSSIPWEAIQLTRDFSNKVFLTATSGSVLAGSFMSENPPKIVFMHNCCDVSGNPSAQKTIETIEALLCDKTLKDSLKTVSCVYDVKDILI